MEKYTDFEKLKMSIYGSAEAVEKLKRYVYRGKKQFRLDFQEYLMWKVNWRNIYSDKVKEWVKNLAI